jgi:hypothetical protein
MPLGVVPDIRSICWNDDNLVFTILCSSEKLSEDGLKQADSQSLFLPIKAEYPVGI